MLESVCRKYTISRATIYRWLENSIEFKREFTKNRYCGIERINDLAVSQLISKIQSGDLKAIIFWLKTRCPEFMERYHKVIIPQTILTDMPLTPEEEQNIADAIQKWKKD